MTERYNNGNSRNGYNNNRTQQPSQDEPQFTPESRPLPQDITAELALLGCLVIDPGEIALVAERLRAEHFYRDSHRVIYRAMMHLYEQNEDADIDALGNLLLLRGELEQAGGYRALNEFVQRPTSTSSLEAYADRVIRMAILRAVIWAGGQMVAAAWDAGELSAQDILELAEGMVFEIAREQGMNVQEAISAGDAFSSWFDSFDMPAPAHGTISGVPSGLRSLDQLTDGFHRSDLIIVAARPAVGKTSFAMSIGRAAAAAGRGVFIASLEMSSEQLVQRLVSIETEIDLHRLRSRHVTPEERAQVVAARPRIESAPIYIDDTAGMSILQLRSKLRREMAQHQIDLVIVDYLQLLTATVDGKRIRERLQEVSEVARGLKNLAKAFNVPVIALSQLSRAVESRQNKIPQLSDLRESGEIEQAADIVMFLSRDDLIAGIDPETGESLSEHPNTADIICAKHRNGPTGEVRVNFDKRLTRFSEPETEYTDEMIRELEGGNYGDSESA